MTKYLRFVDFLDPPEWSALRISDYGFAVIHVTNDSHLHFQQISDDQNGTIVDDFWIIKDRHGPYERPIDL